MAGGIATLNAIARLVDEECAVTINPDGGVIFSFPNASGIEMWTDEPIPNLEDLGGLQRLADRIREHVFGYDLAHRPGFVARLAGADLDTRIDRLHGGGAAAELDRAIADGSIFAEKRAMAEGLSVDEHHQVHGPDGEPLTGPTGLPALDLLSAIRPPVDLDERRAAKAADAGLDEPGMTQAEADSFSRPIDCPPPVTMRHDQIFQPNPGLISAIEEHDSEIQAARPQSSPIRPLGDRVVVLPDTPESTTAGGLVIPAQAQDRPRRGTVLAVGPGKSLMSGLIQPIDIHPGQRVAYATYGGTELDDVIVLREDEILGILEDS